MCALKFLQKYGYFRAPAVVWHCHYLIRHLSTFSLSSHYPSSFSFMPMRRHIAVCYPS